MTNKMLIGTIVFGFSLLLTIICGMTLTRLNKLHYSMTQKSSTGISCGVCLPTACNFTDRDLSYARNAAIAGVAIGSILSFILLTALIVTYREELKDFGKAVRRSPSKASFKR